MTYPMIIKSHTRKNQSFRQLLEYMFKGLPDQESPLIITHNLTGHTLNDWVAEFEENESHRKRKAKNQVFVAHEILSWHNQDRNNLTKEMIEDMTREYIRQRNPNGLYVAVAHFHQAHPHVHICASGIEYKTGTSMRLSKAEFRAMKMMVEDYQVQRYPELSHSRIVHGQGKRYNNREYYVKHRHKQDLIDLLDSIEADSLFQWCDTAESRGAIPYYRRGKLTGVKFQGRKYRFRTLGISVQEYPRTRQYRKSHR